MHGASELSRVSCRSPIEVFRLTFDVPDALVLPSAGGFTFLLAASVPFLYVQVTSAGSAVGRFGAAASAVGMLFGLLSGPADDGNSVGAAAGDVVTVVPDHHEDPDHDHDHRGDRGDADRQVPPLPSPLSSPLGLPFRLPRRQLLLMGLLGHAEPSSPECLQGTYIVNLRTVC